MGEKTLRAAGREDKFMAEVKDYITGKICQDIKKTLALLSKTKEPLAGTPIGLAIAKELKKLRPRKITLQDAMILIREAQKCAVGRRVCDAVHPDSRYAESVFLDELADGMVGAGKARYVTCEEAEETLEKYWQGPLIVTSVSGKYMEICRTYPKNCIYWNIEKHKFPCIER